MLGAMIPRRLARFVACAAALVLTVGLLGAAPGLAQSSSNPVINDCLTHPGGLTGHYTLAQLRHALQVMPAETKEYTSCPDVINRAILAVISGKSSGGSSGSGSGSFLPTPVIVILVILILIAVVFGAMALRRRRDPDQGDGGPPRPPPA
jgi:hypothetical protein